MMVIIFYDDDVDDHDHDHDHDHDMSMLIPRVSLMFIKEGWQSCYEQRDDDDDHDHVDNHDDEHIDPSNFWHANIIRRY